MEWFVGLLAGLGLAWYIWLALIVGLGFLAASTYHEQNTFAGVVGTIVLLVALFFGQETNIFVYMWENPLVIAEYILYYFLIGSAWALWRWIGLGGHAWKTRREYDRMLREFLHLSPNADLSGVQIPERQEDDWIRTVRLADLYPHVSENKERVVTWIAWWPMSMVTYIFADLIIEAAKFIWRRLSNIFSFITRRWVYRGVPEKYIRQQ